VARSEVAAAVSPAPAPVESTRVTPYHGLLFALLSTATFFEGFDISMMSLAAADVRAGLGISQQSWGLIFSITRIGLVASFFLLLFADRFGRRLLLFVTVLGFGVVTGLTTLARDAVEFTALQTLARVFLLAEYALAVIVIGEEFPARLRGRAIGLLTAFSTFGVMVMAKVQPFVLLPAGAEGNWLHDATLAGVGWLQGIFGVAEDRSSWRGLYFLGLPPLILIFFLRFAMRETRRFEAVAAARGKRPWRDELRAQLDAAQTPFQPAYRRRTGIVALLWNFVHLLTAPSVAYWVIYAREEVGLDAHTIGDIVFWAYVAGAFGNFLGGWLIDRIGRKPTCALFYALGSVALVSLFHVTDMTAQYVFHITCVGCFGAAIAATHVYASELFPTAIRATGYAWATNLFGRVTEIATPALVGLMIPSLGITWAVTLVGFGPILGALFVLRYAPETRGLTLEEIEALGAKEPAPARPA
jgi:putative MFS transporter